MPAKRKQPIADALRAALRESGLTPAAFADKVDVHRANVHRFLRKDNPSDPQLSTAEAWAKALGYKLTLTKESKDDSQE